MHDLAELGSNIPAFLAKLWKLVDDPETDDIISWSNSGHSFIISNTIRFTQELLPMYYKHNNMASFIRQLNMYGFHKIVSIESGGLKSEKDVMEFSHTCFFKDHPYLMENIKRKMSSSRSNTPSLAYVKEIGKEINGLAQTEVLAQVLADVNNLKTKQAGWDAKLAAMKRENEALWRELAIFRQKHHKQEQIINKLIQFIVTVVRPTSRNVPLRRRYPLMINDADRTNKVVASSSGPTIRELDAVDQLLGDVEIKVQEPLLKKHSSKNGEYIIPHQVEDLPPEEEEEDEEEFISSNLVENSTPYLVLSPGDQETEPIASPWLNLEGSDVESEAAMTPINPVQINPRVAAVEKPALNQTKPVLRAHKPPSNVTKPTLLVPVVTRSLKNKKSVAGSTSKKSRKNVQPKKNLRTIVTQKVEPEEKSNDLLAEAFNMIEGVELELPPDQADCNNLAGASNTIEGGTILKLLEEAVANPEATLPEETLPASDPNPLVVPEEMSRALDSETLAVARPNVSYNTDDVARYVPQKDLGSHVEMVQGDIDILKEFLKGDGYSLDANVFLELFNDDPMALIMPPPSESKPLKEESGSGGELMTYTSPNLVDLMDMYESTPCKTSSSSPPSPSSSVLETPIMTPASPGFPPPSKKRRK